ncbi:MAG: NifB/NifX family molybdenum-iron cluster-binding protein [Candidatus Egerieousia sp.]
MKIAIPTRDSMVDNHFGHCEHYTILTISDDKKIIGNETLPSPQGCGCKSNIASVLEEMGVKVMLAGSMGQGALNVLTSHNIEVIRGCSGNVMDVAADYLNGKLQDSGFSCLAHGEHHECPDHHA